MKKFIAIAAASFAMLVSAHAAEMEGVVKSVDAAAKAVVLEDGTALTVAEGVALDKVVAGAKVKVTVDDATKAVTAIQVMM